MNRSSRGGPGHIPAGTVRDDPICLTDMLATVAAAAGVDLAYGVGEDGFDVLPVLLGTGGIERQRPIVHHSLAGRFALRRGGWKAIFAIGPGGGFSEPTIGSLFSSGTGKAHATPPWDAQHPEGQLYDMVSDPGETRNLWNDRPEIVAEMYTVLKRTCREPENGFPFDVAL